MKELIAVQKIGYFFIQIMKNFKKVLNPKALTIIICILLLSEYPIFADLNTLRLPLGEITNQRISKTIIVKSLINHFQSIMLDETDMGIMKALSDEIDEEDAIQKFIKNDAFRNLVLSEIKTLLPKDILEIWDMTDKLSLKEADINWIADNVHEGLKEVHMRLSGRKEDIVTYLPKEMISSNIKIFNLQTPLDIKLKNAIRTKIPENLAHNAEWKLRSVGLGAENIKFLTLFIQDKDCSAEIFKESLNLLFSLYVSDKQANVSKMLKERRKIEFQNLFINQRFDEIGGIFSSLVVGRKIDLKKNKPDVPIIETADGSYPYLDGNVLLKKAQKNIALIDYILGMDEDSIPYIFDKRTFDAERSLAPRSERIRTVRDYREMYLKIFPVNKKELIKMSLAVMKRIYLLLNEDVRRLKELESLMKEGREIFQETIITPRLVDVSSLKHSMLDAFTKADNLYKDRNYAESLKTISSLYLELHKGLRFNSYPTVINLDFINILGESATDTDMQIVLKRLNEIDFDSCRLIEFMTTSLSQDYSILKYPYTYDSDNILFFGKIYNNPWEALADKFQEEEKVDISNIKRIPLVKSKKMDFIAFGDTIEIMIFELLKNAITNAHFYPESRKLEGEIRENFYETSEGYCYTIEDNNAGIPKDRLRSVFNICVSYTHFDPERPRYKEFAGLGIGLAKVLAITDMYKGTLRIVSRVDGEKAYELSYREGAFSTIEPIDKNDSEDPLLYKTGTKIFITFPYSIIDMDRILPPKIARNKEDYLPLSDKIKSFQSTNSAL